MNGLGLWMGLATILAVLVGPILAVLITRYMDAARADKGRMLDIYRTLMRTRMVPLHWDHVGALNLVEVEFVAHSAVVDAWKAYLASLAQPLPSLRDRGALLTTLLDKIAQALGIKIEQLDILRGNYVPQGWADDDTDQRLLRRRLLNVLDGNASFPIHVQSPPLGGSPYPPPPNTD